MKLKDAIDKGNNNYQYYAKFGGSNYQHYAKFGGGNNQYGAEFGGGNNQSGITVGKEWFIGQATLTQYPNTTKLLKTAKDEWFLTLPEFARWIAEHPKQTLEILANEVKGI